MATLRESELRKAIASILKGADLTQLSAKKVRKQLEAHYKVDLTDRKKEIDLLVMQELEIATKNAEEEDEVRNKSTDEDEAANGEEEEDEDDEGGESDFDAPDDMGPPVKKSKTSSKVDDEELARQLQEEEDEGGRRTRNKQTKRTPRKKTKGEGQSKRKGTSTYSKPCLLSSDLAQIMGTDQMPRKDVVKKMWEIVRERNLQDPKNRQFMLCDDQLLKVFGKKRIRTFGMMKYLSSHIKDNKDVSS